MKRTGVLQEIRNIRHEELYGRYQLKHLTQAEAAMVQGLDERTFRRFCRKHEAWV